VVFNSLFLFFYSAKLKSIPFVKNLTVSYLVASSFVFGGIVAKNVFPVIFLALLAFLSNVGREIVKDISDIEGDKKRGIKTLPVAFGKFSSSVVATIFVFSAIIFSPLPYLLGLFSINYLYTIIPAVVLFGYSCFLIIISPEKAHFYMKIAMLIVLLAFLVGKF
jgi:geranylgeranylglycerol-phosphate geranylgeranyltransferase